MKEYRGHHLIAMDGDQLDLPASKDILEKGYRGFPVRAKRESHYPRMYSVKAVDLLSGVVLNFEESVNNDEISHAISILPSLPKKTIVIYDRYYLSERLIEGHINNGQEFIARCKSGSTFKEITAFYNSQKKRGLFLFKGKRIYLIKVINPKSKEAIVIATTLEIKEWSNKEIAKLYTLRWDIESNNRDSTSTMKLEQWRTKFYNGIMQEVYAHLILMNLSKITIFLEGGYHIDLEEDVTKKSNFKLVLSTFIDKFSSIVTNAIDKAIGVLRFYINKSIEKRKRLSRAYDRKIKKSHRRYNIVFTARRSLN